MALILKPRHLGRYRDIARLLVKYGRSDVVHNIGLDEALDETDSREGDAPAEALELADDLERLGPTFIKLGQLLSTRADLLPPAYTAALARLQDSVEPFPFSQVEEIVTHELGVKLSSVFPSFEVEPLASASLGQVHRAELRDGRSVAVKVQRPGIRDRIVEDMEALGEIADFLDAHTEAGRRFGFADLLDQFRHSLMGELDYRREAANLTTMGNIVARYDRIVVPSPVDDLTTTRVLTMDLVKGRKITKLGPLAQMEMDGRLLAEQLFQAYLDQILVEGFFHADPHPGNVFLTDDHHLALLDLGMVARVPAAMRNSLVRLLLAVSDGRGEDVADVAVRMGRPLDGFDRDRFTREVAELVAVNQTLSVE
ncbi:MAG: ubiquinone biosynthesis protein, partial [Acidimicrobiaceae bacterium]|nr:ubiquinone biosynthesis protein [Acidimicrobiaceae bacterium]